MNRLTPLGLTSLCLLHYTSLASLILVYQITLSMASWIVCYEFMITCSIMAVASE